MEVVSGAALWIPAFAGVGAGAGMASEEHCRAIWDRRCADLQPGNLAHLGLCWLPESLWGQQAWRLGMANRIPWEGWL